MGERLLCKQEVVGSIPSGSTRRGFLLVRKNVFRIHGKPRGLLRVRDI